MKTISLIFAIGCMISQMPKVVAAASEQEVQPSRRENFQKKIQSKFDKLNAKINDLESKSEKGGAKTKKEFQTDIKKLKSDKDEARKKIDKLKDSSSDAWETLRKETQRTIDNLDASFRKVADITSQVPLDTRGQPPSARWAL